jgi:hypothetical protein
MQATPTDSGDIPATAKHLAERDHETFGEVSALAPQGLSSEARIERNGVLLLPCRRDTTKATPDLVNQLSNELP